MKTPPAYPGTVKLKLPTLIVSAMMLSGGATVASAEPPWRGMDRGSRVERPRIVESWRDVQENVQRDFTEARDNVRQDMRWVRENARREAERVRYEVEQRRQRGFQFVDVLDVLFGRPGGPPPVQQRYQQDRSYYDESSYQAQQPRDDWEREDRWAERFEDVQQDRASRRRQSDIEPIPPLETAPKDKPRINRESTTPVEKVKPPRKTTPAPAPKPKAKSKPAVAPPARQKEKLPVPPPLSKENSISTSDELADLAVENTSKSRQKAAPEPKTQAKDTYPYGLPVPGKDGMVYSPYVEESGKYVDVRNIPAGTLVKDPYSDKFFRVP